jgi:multidrug resistance efflux pump
VVRRSGVRHPRRPSSAGAAPIGESVEAERAPPQVSERRHGLSEVLMRNPVRLFKSLFGLLLVILAVGLFRKYVLMTISADAVVITDFIEVVAPIEGFVQHGKLEIGSTVEANQPLGRIQNPIIDRTGIAELRARIKVVDGDILALESVIATLDGLGGRFEARGDKYQKRRADQARLLVLEAQSRVDADQARLSEAQTRLQRVESMIKIGLAPQQRSDEAHRDATVAERTLFASQRELESLSATLDALKQGVSLGDFSSMDKSYSSQRGDEITMRLAQLRGDLAEKTAERPALAEQLAALEHQVAILAEMELKVPHRSRLWAINTADGVFVQRGWPLMKLVDCTHLRVLAYLTERNYNDLRVGDRAEIEIISTKQRFDGHIDLRLGSPELRLPVSGALTVPTEQRERYAVLVSSPDLTAAFGQSCDVGQNVEVTFRRSK